MARLPQWPHVAIAAALFLLPRSYADVSPQQASENIYRLYTRALHVDEAGVVVVPARYKWSVETSTRGIDANGNVSPDQRVMLRLYDPNKNFTALTAQMDLATAAKLHHDLGELIVKKLQDANFQHRPQLYDRSMIPVGRFQGIDKDGQAIIELTPRSTPPSADDQK